jgi:hypothetical protein
MTKHECTKHGLVEFRPPNRNGDSICTLCWNEAEQAWIQKLSQSYRDWPNKVQEDLGLGGHMSISMGVGKNPCEEVGPPTSYFEKPHQIPSIGCPVEEPRYIGPNLDLTEHSKNLMGSVGPPRLCPGCRSLDGEHDFGPTCMLKEGM